MFFLLAALLSAGMLFASKNMVANVVAFAITGVINYLFLYFCLPILSLGYPGMAALLFTNFILVLIFSFAVQYQTDYDFSIPSPAIITLLIIGLLSTGALVVRPIFSSWAFFNADKYRALLGEVEEGNFSTETTPIDLSQLRVVDQSLAAKLAEKRLGEDFGLGSQVKIGEMNIQQVKNKLYWVGALDYSAFLRWWDNKKGTPGYVMVSATDEKDVHLVKKIGDQQLLIKYNGGSCFEDSPKRYLYEHGYSGCGLTDFTFELNDEGRPYYTVTKFKNKVGFFGGDATGTIILDVQTGEIKEYSIEETPAWVDRIQPEDFITEQIDNWGHFIHGWKNSWKGKKEMIQSTPGMSLVYGKDGKSYWYTGISSAGEDESTIGYMLIDTRTKKAKLYRQVGATETAAQSSAQGAVQEKEYQATFPIFYNVAGIPTYFCTLKDQEGLVKAMAFISVENYNTYGIGATKEQALRQYMSNLNSKGNSVTINSDIERMSIRGKVLRKGAETINNGTAYYFLISGYEDKFFYAGNNLSNELVLTNIGDSVVMEYTDGKSEVIDAVSFENLFLNPKATAEISK
jgi:hypothetical protein